MGREIRKVPPDWEHPKDEKGHFQPLFDQAHRDEPKSHVMPSWSEEEATHFQIYENVSEGTPVSPVFANLDDMKDWLLKEGFSEKAATMFVKDGLAPSMVMIPGKDVSGTGIRSLDWL